MLEIMPFQAAHHAGVRDLILAIQQQEFGVPICYEDQPDLHDIAGFYRRGCGDFWVAVADGAVVGTIALIDIGDRLTALRKMFVRADYRGAGHGTASRLLSRLIDHARERNVETIYLGTTAAFLAAHRFYEKAGFRLIDASELPESFPRMLVDTRFYELPLSRGAGEQLGA